VRQVPHSARRLAEAARLGFATAVVPAKTPDVDADIDIVRVATVREAMKALGLTGSTT
jgi:predicted ATP-dependent serine protease